VVLPNEHLASSDAAREKTRPGPDIIPSWPILVLIKIFILFSKCCGEVFIKNIYFILFNVGNDVPKSFTEKRNHFLYFNHIPVFE
jgi:hypothetical protein